MNVTAGTRVMLESHSGHWFVVQVRKAHRAEMLRPMEVAEPVRKRYLERRWRLDHYVVSESLRCGSGFAVSGYRNARRFECEATAGLTLLPGHELAEVGAAPAFLASRPLLAGWRPVRFGRRCSPAEGRGVVDQRPGRAGDHRPRVVGAMKERPCPYRSRGSDRPAGQLRRRRRRVALGRLEHRPPQSGHVVEECRPGNAAIVDVGH